MYRYVAWQFLAFVEGWSAGSNDMDVANGVLAVMYATITYNTYLSIHKCDLAYATDSRTLCTRLTVGYGAEAYRQALLNYKRNADSYSYCCTAIQGTDCQSRSDNKQGSRSYLYPKPWAYSSVWENMWYVTHFLMSGRNVALIVKYTLPGTAISGGVNDNSLQVTNTISHYK